MPAPFMSHVSRTVRATLATVLAVLAVLAATVSSGTAAVAPGAGPGPGPGPGPWHTRSLPVLTYNIHHAEGTDAVLDLDRVARVIRDSKADVVALQEVDRHYSARSEWADQAEELGRRLRMQVTFGANIDNPPPTDRPTRIQYGTAILSRIPMKPAGNTHLYRSPDQEQRGLLHAVVDVGGVKVDVYNTHLAASSAFDRGQQATQIVDLIGEPKRPTVLMGDLNATAEAPEITTLTELLDDVWPVVGSVPGNTIGSLNPTKRIDYVLVAGGVEARSAEVITATPEASDHLPVLTELEVRSGPGR